MTSAHLSIITPLGLQPAVCADLLALLGERLPGCLPHRFGSSEPLRETWQGPESVDRFCADTSVHWRSRSTPRCRGSLIRRYYPDDLHSHVTITPGKVPGPEAAEVLDSLASRVAADYGHLHALTERELRPLISGGVRDLNSVLVMGVSTWVLQRWLPELYWATAFGPPYVSLIGADVIRSAPAYQVRELAPDRFVVQLTEKLTDVETAPAEFERVRAAVKEHLGPDLFFDEEVAEDGNYRAPVFAAAPADPGNDR